MGYIYTDTNTIWEEIACQPDSAAALETTSPKTSEPYLAFRRSFKDYLRLSMRTKRVKREGGVSYI